MANFKLSKSWKISLSVVGALLALLIIIPLFIPLETYKPMIEEKATEALGRQVKIEGPISASLLPLPSVKVENIRLANEKGAAFPDMVTLASAKASVGWVSFGGKVHLSSVKLEEPKVHLQVFENGKNNWDSLAQAAEKKPEPANTSEAKEKVAVSAPKEDSSEPAISIGKISIEEGTITYSEGKKTTKVEDLNLSVALDSFTGPFSVKGDLKLDGKFLKIKGTAGSLSDPKMFLDMKAEYGDQEVGFKGHADLATKAFDGKVNGRLDAREFVKGTPFSKSYALSGDIKGSEEKVDLTNLLITDEKKINLQGSVHVFIKEARAEASLVGLPGSAKIKLKTPFSLNGGQLDLSVAKPAVFATFMELPVQEYPDLLKSSLTLKTAFFVKPEEQSLKDLKVTLGKKGLSGSLTWKEPTALYNLTVENAAAWLKALKVDARPGLGNITVKGSVKQVQKDFDLDTTILLLGGSVGAKGRVSPDKESADLKLSVDHGNLNGFLASFGQPQAIQFGFLKAFAHVKGNAKAIDIQNLKVTVKPGAKPSTLTGQGSLALGKVTKVRFALNSDRVDLVGMKTVNQPAAAPKKALVASRNPSKKKGKAGKWDKKPLDLSFLKTVDADIKINIKRLIGDTFDFKKLVVPIRVNGKGIVTSAKGRFFDGPMQANVDLKHGKTNTLATTFSVEKANLGAAAKRIADQDIKGGVLDAKAKLNASGNSMHQLMHSLQGNVNMHAAGGKMSEGFLGFIPQFSVSGLLNQLDHKKKKKKKKSKKSDKLVSMHVDAPVQKGVLTLKRADLSTPLGPGTGRGKVNLGAWTINTRFELILKELKVKPAPKVKVKTTGSLDAPKNKISLPNLSKVLFKEGAEFAAKEAVEDLVENAILPGSSLLKDGLDIFGKVLKK